MLHALLREFESSPAFLLINPIPSSGNTHPAPYDGWLPKFMYALWQVPAERGPHCNCNEGK